MTYLCPGLPEMFQGSSCKVITGPPGHDDDDLSAFLQTGQHCVCEPSPVLLLSQFVIGLLGVFDEVIDDKE